MTLSTVIIGTVSDTDYTDVSDESTYGIVEGTFSAPPPGRRDTGRVVSFLVEIDAEPYDLLLDAQREIQIQLDRAFMFRKEHSQRWVVCGVRFGDSTNTGYFSVADGLAEIVPASITGPHIQVGRLYVQVTLFCLRTLYTDKVTLTASGTITNTAGTPATPGNTGSGGLFLENILGDEPAWCRLRLIDVSTGVVINRLTIGAIGRRSMANGDFPGWTDQTEISPASAATAEANRVGADYAELVCTDSWQAAATFTGGTDTEVCRGEFAALLRVWSNAGALSRPTNLAGVRTNQSLSVDTYIVKVTSIDAGGSETDASDQISIVITGTSNNGIDLTWTVNGSASDHKVYFKRGSQAWKWFATSSGTGAYSLTTESGATTGDPPSVSDIGEPYVRLAYGDTSLNTVEYSRAVQLHSGTSPVWVNVGYVQLPPVPTGEEETPERWKARAEFVNGVSGASQTARVDALALMPRRNTITCEIAGLASVTKYEWWIGTRRDGRSFCQLRSTSDQSAQGWASAIGELRLPPGDVLLNVLADIAAGVTSVSGQYTLQVDYWSQWVYWPGTM